MAISESKTSLPSSRRPNSSNGPNRDRFVARSRSARVSPHQHILIVVAPYYGRMATIRQLVLDVLKPHEPTMLSIAQAIAETDGVDGVNAILIEMDEEVRNIKFTVEGDDIDYDEVTAVIEDTGATVHSVDQVACGDRIVEDAPTPQD